MSDDEDRSVPALLQAETMATTNWIQICDVCGANKVMVWHSWMHELFVLKQENEQLRQQIARLTQELDTVTQERDGLWNVAMRAGSEEA